MHFHALTLPGEPARAGRRQSRAAGATGAAFPDAEVLRASPVGLRAATIFSKAMPSWKRRRRPCQAADPRHSAGLPEAAHHRAHIETAMRTHRASEVAHLKTRASGSPAWERARWRSAALRPFPLRPAARQSAKRSCRRRALPAREARSSASPISSCRMQSQSCASAATITADHDVDARGRKQSSSSGT